MLTTMSLCSRGGFADCSQVAFVDAVLAEAQDASAAGVGDLAPVPRVGEAFGGRCDQYL